MHAQAAYFKRNPNLLLYMNSPKFKSQLKEKQHKTKHCLSQTHTLQANSAHESPFRDPPVQDNLQGPFLLQDRRGLYQCSACTVCLHEILGSLINMQNLFPCADVSCVLKEISDSLRAGTKSPVSRGSLFPTPPA